MSRLIWLSVGLLAFIALSATLALLTVMLVLHSETAGSNIPRAEFKVAEVSLNSPGNENSELLRR